jgi:hypothetical protein
MPDADHPDCDSGGQFAPLLSLDRLKLKVECPPLETMLPCGPVPLLEEPGNPLLVQPGRPVLALPSPENVLVKPQQNLLGFNMAINTGQGFAMHQEGSGEGG